MSSSGDGARATIASLRHEYESAGLDVGDVDPDPMVQWQRWYEQAAAAGCVEPHAFVLATVDEDGAPHTRYVLARGADERGFSFFTNYDSAKSRQMAAAPAVSALFTWLQLHRQVRVVGHVDRLPEHESDAYFASRPRASQIGAWASPQSQVLGSRRALEDRVRELEQTFAGVDQVPRPSHWGGWLLRPSMYEFWQGRPSRLHDRVRYRPAPDAPDTWITERLAP